MNIRKDLLYLSAIAYLLFSISCFFTTSLLPTNPYWLVTALVCIVLAVVFHLLSHKGKRKQFYYGSILLNNFGSGISVGCYFVLEDHILTAWELLLSFLVFLLLTCLMLTLHEKVNSMRKYAFLTFGIFTILLLPCIYLWSPKENPLLVCFGFTIILAMFYNISYVLQQKENRSLLRDFSFGSFGAFFLLSYLVLVLVTDGDALEVLDGVDLPTNKKKKNTISL